MSHDTYIFETFKSSLLFYFSTGNLVLDSFAAGLIIWLLSLLKTSASRFHEIDFGRWLKRIFGEGRIANEIIISGKKVETSNGSYHEYSDRFHAVLFRIKKLNCAESNIFRLRELPLAEAGASREYSYCESCDGEQNFNVCEQNADKDKNGGNLIVSQDVPFKLDEKVEGIVTISKDDRNAENRDAAKTLKTEEFQIIIRSHEKSMDELRGLIINWVNEYKKSIAPDDYLRYFLYVPPDSNDYRSRYYSEFRFESGKSFENLFFPEKEQFIEKINFFQDNKRWYKKRGIPYTMGLLLHGEPGCGKTSTIKAIANYTQRHIISVSLNKIKTCKELLDVFYSTRINQMDIPLKKRLYVLEDIDCSEMKDIIKDRSSTDDENKESDDSGKGSETTKRLAEEEAQNFFSLFKGPVEKADKFFSKTTQKLTLAGILEVFDGVMEMDGRMLVITTNYPERLDSALIRPGRIDMKIKFSKCTNKCLVQMYEAFFEDFGFQDLSTNVASIWPHEFDKSLLPENRWTPAEATQVLLKNMNNPQQGLEDLVHTFPKAL